MIDVPFPKLDHSYDAKMGEWLDQNMPNPPLPEPQRWSVGYSQDGRVGIRFANDEDATLFLLRWAG